MAGPFPGALRFLDGGGGAELGSGLTEKLDMPGSWSFGMLGGAALLVIDVTLGVVVDERRTLAADGLSASPECVVLGMEGPEPACGLLVEVQSYSISSSRSSA